MPFITLSLGPPVISLGPADHSTINNGSSVDFRCYALASPEHQVSWTFINPSGVRMLIISTTDMMDTAKYRINRGSAMDFGSLTVLDVRFSDRGTYSCNASNNIGSVTAEANLTVQGELLHSVCIYVFTRIQLMAGNKSITFLLDALLTLSIIVVDLHI